VPQFECWIVASPNGSTQPCRLRSHPDSLGAGKVGFGKCSHGHRDVARKSLCFPINGRAARGAEPERH
jgi:hypothetical protein